MPARQPASPPARNRRLGKSLLCVFFACSYVEPSFAWESWLFATNSIGNGHEGVRVEVGTDGSGRPCPTSVEVVDWSPSGASWGLARNWDIQGDESIYASISANNVGPDLCEGAANDDCIGVGKYLLGTGGGYLDGQSYDPYYNENLWPRTPQAVDGLGNLGDVIVIEKLQDDISNHEYADIAVMDPFAITGGSPELTQLEWIDGEYFLVTDAQTVASGRSCDVGSWTGRLLLGRAGDDSYSATNVGPSYGRSKPEGLEVFPILGDPVSQGCSANADYVAYVTDYCQSDLYVYSIDMGATPIVVSEEAVLNMDVDPYSDYSILSDSGAETCHPNSVTFASSHEAVFLTCQNPARSSIMRVDIGSGVCNPDWTADSDHETMLERLSSGSPSCSSPPTPSDCTVAVNCQPHGVSWDKYAFPNWVFVAQTNIGVIMAVDISNLENQSVVWADSTDFEPREVEILPNEPPG